MKAALEEGEWEALVRRIRAGRCTPFLGAGASAHVLPTGAQLADRWANTVHYPLPERGDLARVAQYMAITRDEFEPKELVSEMCKAINPAEALQAGDCYDLVAGLDLPIFITTNYDDLLLQALQDKRKEPERLLCPWRPELLEHVEATYTYQPTIKEPLVYHLHGTAHVPWSIVVTEDDYMDFIVWLTHYWQEQADMSHVSPHVKKALAQNCLLFIGYSQNDWSFRVLMRSMKHTGNRLGVSSIAVQLSPLAPDASEVDQELVTAYLTEYFKKIHGSPVKVYWGTALEFLTELRERLAA